MSNFKNIAIVASFFGLWIDSFLSYSIQMGIGFVLIFTFGILHGANDILLIEKIKDKEKSFTFLKTLLVYILIVLLGALFFYLMPWLALILFIIVSGYHFGEQQWKFTIKTDLSRLIFFFQLVYGLLLLFLIFNFHLQEVQKIIFEISLIKVPIQLFINLLKLIFILFVVVSVILFYKKIEFKKKILKELFYILVFTIIFKTSSLIWGFALYFVLWHSIPSILDQIKFLYGGLNQNSIKLYFRSALIYWIFSLLGILSIYFIFKDQKIFNALFFSFLASITFPHVFVILEMFKKK